MALQIYSERKTAPFRWFHALRHGSGKQWALGTGILALVVAFPDLALMLAVQAAHAVGFVLHIVIGLVELGIEHLVDAIFDVPRHTAQLITAWTLLFIFLLLAVWRVRKGLSRAPASAPPSPPSGE